MKYMQKYVLVHTLEPIADNTQFSMSDWPLHVTLSPRFAVDIKQPDLVTDLKNLLAKKKPIKTIVKNDERFGQDHHILVSLLDLTSELYELHNEVLDLLEFYGAVFDDPNYSRSGYRPHVTVQKTGRVNMGDDITINSLTLVDMYPEQNIKKRKILETYPFKKI
jgi:2'-5' RNA ligase